MGERQSAEERKPAILKAFYDVISIEGFENASIAKVAARAGVNPSLVIHYFGTKENMVIDLVDHVMHIYAAMFRDMGCDGDGEEQLSRLLNLLWSRSWYEGASFSVMYSILALSRRQPAVHERIKGLYGHFRSFLISRLEAFNRMGVICVDDIEASAELLIALCEGSNYFCHFFTLPEKFDAHRDNMIRSARALLGASIKGDKNDGEEKSS